MSAARERRYAILSPGMFADRRAKTAHGVIAYGRDRTVAVIDPDHAGRSVHDVVPYLKSDAPVVASLAEALPFDPNALLIGVAPPGGALPRAWRETIVHALGARLEVVSGLHEMLAGDAEFERAAVASGARIWDVRSPPPPRLFSGEGYAVAARVVLTVGTDCAVGKMTAALELTRAATLRGAVAAFVATGQTGIMIASGGIAIDRVIADFAAGAAESLVLENAGGHDVLFVEGQGGINHPAFAPVTLALLYGCAPDALVLVHAPPRSAIDDYRTPLLGYRRSIALYEELCAAVKPARVAGIALNTSTLSESSAREAVARARAETGLPADDVVRFGPERFYDEIAPAITRKGAPLRALAEVAP